MGAVRDHGAPAEKEFEGPVPESFCRPFTRLREVGATTDRTSWTFKPDETPKALVENYALIGPIDAVEAQANRNGALKTAVQEAGGTEETLNFGK